jgi:hypothetical protein
MVAFPDTAIISVADPRLLDSSTEFVLFKGPDFEPLLPN